MEKLYNDLCRAKKFQIVVVKIISKYKSYEFKLNTVCKEKTGLELTELYTGQKRVKAGFLEQNDKYTYNQTGYDDELKKIIYTLEIVKTDEDEDI